MAEICSYGKTSVQKNAEFLPNTIKIRMKISNCYGETIENVSKTYRLITSFLISLGTGKLLGR